MSGIKKIKLKNTEIHMNDYDNMGQLKTCYNYIETLLNKCIIEKKTNKKIDIERFIVPKIDNYFNIIDINYSLQQLKTICKKYNLKTSGNKEFLKRQCYNYMYYSCICRKIQSWWRQKLTNIYIYWHGPGFYNRDKCVNSTDFISLDEMNEIPYNQFFSFKDDLNLIYGFDIKSLYNYYIKKQDELIIENPYTKKPMPNDILYNMSELLRYTKIINLSVEIDYKEFEELNKNKALNHRIVNVFQEIDRMGNYTNILWFTKLQKNELIKFISELVDIWKYRAILSNQVKREIIPPYGDPFTNITLYNISLYNYYELKVQIVRCMELLTGSGINQECKKLGALYILTALTLVSSDAAEALPWLYESVSDNL